MIPPILIRQQLATPAAIGEATEAARLAFDNLEAAAYTLRAAIELQEADFLPTARERYAN